MSSELYDILNKLAPDGELGTGTGNYFFEEQKVLLWTNASPTSSFAAQTIPLNLSSYDALEIEFMHDISSSKFFRCVVSTFKDSIMFQVAGLSLRDRSMASTSSGIRFENGEYTNLTSVSPTTRNDCIVPYKIYGIKKIG